MACGSNQNPNAAGCASFGTSLYTFLAAESAGERSEYSFANFVVPPGTYGSPGTTVTVPPNDCLGAAVPGLTHTPGACYAYNANVRAVETGAITYPDASTCWVGIDQNRGGLTGAPAHFSRVAGTHYLLDCIDAFQPAMTPSSQLLMEVTTSGGAITQVIDLRHVGSVPAYLNPAQGIFNIAAFSGFSASLATTTVTIASGSVSGTLANPAGFAVGDQVLLRHAGSSATIAAPTGVTLSLLTDGIPVAGELLATGNGSTQCFLNTLQHGRPKIGSVQVSDATDGLTSNYDVTFGTNNVFNPTGHGFFNGAQIPSGDVDYLNARAGVCFSFPPSNGAAITINYSYVPPTQVPTPKYAGCSKDITTDSGSGPGANCSTSWGVQVVAQAADGSSSAPSVMQTVTNGPLVASWANRIRMSWNGNAQAAGWRIFMCRDPTNSVPANCTPTLVATNFNIWYKNTAFQACAGCASPTAYDYDYIGGTLPGASNAPSDNIDGTALPAAASAAALSTTITALNGSAVNFALPPSQPGPFLVVHDIMPVIETALAAATTAAGNVQEIWLPCGAYAVASTYNLTDQLAPTIHGCGSGSSAGQGTQLYWFGGSGMTAFNFVNVNSPMIENISFGGNTDSNGTSDLGSWISHDGVLPFSGFTPSHLRLLHNSFRDAGDVVVIGNRSTADVENAEIDDTWIQGVHRHQYSYYIAGAAQTNSNKFLSGGTGLSDVGWLLNGGGEAYISYSQGLSNAVDFADGEPGVSSGIVKAITVDHFYGENTDILFTFLGTTENQPAEITNGWFQPSNGTPPSIPSTTQPSIPASGMIGISAWQNTEISSNYIGFYALPVPQQIWVGRSVVSSGNTFSQTTPPYVPYLNTASIASLADRVAVQPGNWGTYGAFRPLGSIATPSGAGASLGNALIAPKISGFKTVGMPAPTVTLSQTGSATNVCTYQIVVVDSGGLVSGPSPAVSIGCPPIGTFNATNYVKISTNTTGGAADHVDVLTSATRGADTAHTIGSFPCSGVGPCYGFDLGQGVMPYTAPVRGNSADITMATGGQYHNTPATISTLPATCSDGDEQVVSDWNATIGTCAGGGSTRVRATCNNANTWQCP